MKAAVYYEIGAPDVFRYEDVADPECGANAIRIDVKAISIEGGDVLARAFVQPGSTPFVVGYTASGIVSEVGSDVDGFSVGQRVATVGAAGSHAAQRVVPASGCWILPDGVSFEQGACATVTCGTAHEGLFEFGSLKAGETVLVQGGAGGVGIAGIQMAKAAGARVFATASSDARLAQLTSLGLDEGINYVESDLVAEVMRLTDKKGVDLVLDPIGGHVLEQSIAATAHRGRIVSVGTASRDFSKIDMTGLAPGNKSLTGVFLGAEMTSKRVHDVIDGVIQSMADGNLEVPIDKTFALSEAAAAHAYIESRQAVGRVILVP